MVGLLPLESVPIYLNKDTDSFSYFPVSGATNVPAAPPGVANTNFQQSPFQTASATVPAAAPFPKHARIPNNVPKGGRGGKHGRLLSLYKHTIYARANKSYSYYFQAHFMWQANCLMLWHQCMIPWTWFVRSCPTSPDNSFSCIPCTGNIEHVYGMTQQCHWHLWVETDIMGVLKIWIRTKYHYFMFHNTMYLFYFQFCQLMISSITMLPLLELLLQLK